jgi:NACalpha-BTF3-like transcription factor
LNTVVKFFIILIVLVFDPLAIALVIAFNGMVYKKPEVTTEDTNKLDKTYEIYGEKSSLVENIPQKPDEIPVIVENSQQEEPEVEFIPNLEENHNIVVNKSNYPTDFDSKTY